MAREGRVFQLMDEYENLWCDLSAGSGSCAIMRDHDRGLDFIHRFSDRLLFATDMTGPDMVFPLHDYLADCLAEEELSQAEADRIFHGNFERLFCKKTEAGAVTPALRTPEPPVAFLAIGDEALRLRHHPDYPVRVDLAEAWRDWTGLPFIFGLWVVSRAAADQGFFREDPGALMRRARDWGLANMNVILDLTAHGCPLSREELAFYYSKGLVYTLRGEELDGLRLFYDKLAAAGMIEKAPPLRFFKM